MINNQAHVKGIRDLVHGALQQFAAEHGIDQGGLSATDATCALAWVLRDLIKQAPDAQTRAELAAGARYAIDDAGRAFVAPPKLLMPPAGHA